MSRVGGGAPARLPGGDPTVGRAVSAPRRAAAHSVRQRAGVHCQEIASLVEDPAG